ncbi:MAG: thiamine-phosphate kinase [Actinomycetota bacterium]|nr:thiamine-phosphate kinase [Actinomycetota bacterium]
MSSPSSMTLSELGEFALIDAVRSAFASNADVLVGSGDDAALLATTGSVLVTTDLMVDGRHFRRDWSSATDVGHKVAAANLADIAAMGGVATALVVGLAAPGDTPVSWVQELSHGIAAEVAEVGASVVGGDMCESDTLLLSVTALGRVDGAPVLRSGARAGDVVAVAGRLGWAAAGLAVLGRGFRSPRVVVEAHRRPNPPYAAGPQAQLAGATALIDVSDGLLADLGHVARASGVAIDVDTSCFELAEPLLAVGSALGVDPLDFCLCGGDDHALVATFPAGVALPQGWWRIGVAGPGEEVTVDGAKREGSTGHRHFA